MAVHLFSFLSGALFVAILMALGILGVLVWLATPVRSSPYLLVPDKEVEARIKEEQEADLSSLMTNSSSGTGGGSRSDEEEYHCGWVYLTFEYHELPQINLAVLQEMRGISRPAGVFFLILHKSSLFLYDNEAQETCLGVTGLDGFLVEIFPHSLLLDDIYRKDCPIRITNPTGNILGSNSPSLFIYPTNGSEKEDWLYALRRASGGVTLEVQKEREKLDFTGFMAAFEANLASQDTDGTGDLISALLARIMFNVHRAAEVEQFIREKFIQRTETLPKPFFLGELVLEEIDIGRAAPIFSNGRLHSASHNGELVGSLDIFYPGGLNLKISTQITTPMVVPIVVSVAVKRLAGRIMLKIKGPPTDRLWFGFYRLPDYEISVDPVVSNMAVTWSFVQRGIMKKIEEALLEFLVLPNMADLVIPPLISGPMFIGERPFELEPVPPVALEKIIESAAYSAEGLSRRSPSVVSLEALGPEGRRTIEGILRAPSTTAVGVTNRKIFVSLTERQLSGSSPLLASLAEPAKDRKEDPEHPHLD